LSAAFRLSTSPICEPYSVAHGILDAYGASVVVYESNWRPTVSVP